jgi:hypothetical protein
MQHVNRGPYWVEILLALGWGVRTSSPLACVALAGGLISRDRWARTHRRGPGCPWDHVYLTASGRWLGLMRHAPTRADPENHD